MPTSTKLALSVLLAVLTASATFFLVSSPASALPCPNKWNLDDGAPTPSPSATPKP
ncbi:hypothetical protein [Cryptosporangium sp. NPDC051539]|uniref:hypothetical protein n=1 Tax=Cryptosporangium sp. NPDC051539 TaxID=3363962 RepID=UPI0037935FA6